MNHAAFRRLTTFSALVPPPSAAGPARFPPRGPAQGGVPGKGHARWRGSVPAVLPWPAVRCAPEQGALVAVVRRTVEPWSKACGRAVRTAFALSGCCGRMERDGTDCAITFMLEHGWHEGRALPSWHVRHAPAGRQDRQPGPGRNAGCCGEDGGDGRAVGNSRAGRTGRAWRAFS